MKKILLIVYLIGYSFISNSQTPMTLSLTSSSGAFSITCGNPTLNIFASSNYTAGFVTYTMNAGTYTTTGPTFNINTPGNYTITGFATNSINATQTLVIGINTINPTSGLTPVSQTISCANPVVQSVSVIATPSTNIIHQFIAPQGGTTTANTYTAVFTPGPGTYTNIAIDQLNGCKVAKTFTVFGGGGFPTFSVSSPQNFSLGCGTHSVATINILNAQTTNSNGIGNGGVCSSTIIPSGTSIYSTSTSYSVAQIYTPGTWTVIVVDLISGCETKVPISILQNTLSPSIIVSVPYQILDCSTSTQTIIGNSTASSVSYNWISAAGTTTNSSLTVSTTANTSNTIAGIYTLTIDDVNNGCQSSTLVTIFQNIFPPNAIISNSAASSITSCATPSIVLVNQSSTGIPNNIGFPNSLPIVNYTWNGPSPQTSSANSTTYTAYTPGNYTMVVKDLNNGCFSTTTALISDHRTYPNVNPNAYCSEAQTATVDIAPILSGNTSGFTYFWLVPAAASVSSVTTPTLHTNALGIYTVSVTDPSNSCTSKALVTVTLCTAFESTDLENNSISIFPNPSEGIFSISVKNSAQHLSLQIYNAFGQLIKTQKIGLQEHTLNLENEAKGVYFISLYNNESKIYSSKIIKN